MSLYSHNQHLHVKFSFLWTVLCNLERCDFNALMVLKVQQQSVWMQGQVAPR